MYKFDLKNKMFCDNANRFNELCNDNYFISKPAQFKEVDMAVVLPCKASDGSVTKSEGGICSSSGDLIAGHLISFDNPMREGWWTCLKNYKYEINQLEKRNEIVIFGGFLHTSFGHFLTESISRLWYIIENPDLKHKVIFLNLSGQDGTKNKNILDSIGLTEDKYEVIVQPTQFSKIIVPDQSLFIGSGYRYQNRYIYDKIISNAKPANFKKIYLSKSKYHGNNSKREVYFDEFYRKRGFEVVYPEKLPFLEQVSIVNGADEVVCSVGTIQHLTFFCKDNAKLTVLGREYNHGPINKLGMYSIQLRNLNTYLVDVSFNFMPLTHVRAPFLIGPTKHWINYLNSQSITYNANEVSFDIHVKPYVYDYLIEWAKYYNEKPIAYVKIKNFVLPDVIKTIHQTFLDETIDTKKFPERDDVVKMQNQIKELTATIEKQKLQLEEQKQSVDLKENITQVVTQMGLPEAHQKLARQTEGKFNIVRNIVTKMEDNLKSTDKDLEEKCEILKDQVKKQNEKIKLLEEKFIQLEENSKSKGLFSKK